jgi:hypothetical protein
VNHQFQALAALLLIIIINFSIGFGTSKRANGRIRMMRKIRGIKIKCRPYFCSNWKTQAANLHEGISKFLDRLIFQYILCTEKNICMSLKNYCY